MLSVCCAMAVRMRLTTVLLLARWVARRHAESNWNAAHEQGAPGGGRQAEAFRRRGLL